MLNSDHTDLVSGENIDKLESELNNVEIKHNPFHDVIKPNERTQSTRRIV